MPGPTMTPLPEALVRAIENQGVLTNNNILVEQLRSALCGGENATRLIPLLLEEVIDEDAWVSRSDLNGRSWNFDRSAFVEFIEAPEPRGLGTTKDGIRRYLGDSSNPLRVRFEALAEGRPGGKRPSHPAPTKDASGRFAVVHPDDSETEETAITHNISNDGQPDSPRPRQAQTGTSIGYTVRRLEREASTNPSAAEAYERLKAGEISANAAAVQAGFRPKQITMPADPRAAGRRMRLHFSREQFVILVEIAMAEFDRTEAR